MRFTEKAKAVTPFTLPAHPGGATGRISKAVLKYLKMIASIDSSAKIGVACSGGPDSLVLAVSVMALAPRLGLEPVAAIVDHGWRPESGAEAEVVKKRLIQYGYHDVSILKLPPATVGRPYKNYLGLEGQARQDRYRVLESWLKSYGEIGKKSFLLLGHTRDDQAETVLLGLARGSGAGSIKGMLSFNRQTGYCRPLLDISRQDIEAMCAENQLIYLRDPSNYLDSSITTKQGTPLLRTALRHKAIPILSASLGIDIRVPLAKTAKRLQADEEALNWLVDEHLKELVENSENDIEKLAAATGSKVGSLPFGFSEKIGRGEIKLLIKTDTLQSMPESLRKRIWHRLCLLAGSPGGRLKTAQIEMIDQLVVSKRRLGPLDLPGKVQVCRLSGQPFIYFYQGG